MKKAYIFVKDHPTQGSRGDIYRVMESGWKGTLTNDNWVKEFDIPEGVDENFIRTQIDEQGDIQVIEDTSKKESSSVESQIKQEYDSMNKEIYSEMEKVFGTKKPESSTAAKLTWDDMLSNLSIYAFSGIVADFSRGEYTDSNGDVVYIQEGDELDTEEKIKSYATKCIEEARQFGIWRQKRIAQFKEAKKQILS